MKRFVVLVLFVVFLIGCTRTQVVYPTQTEYVVKGEQEQQKITDQNLVQNTGGNATVVDVSERETETAQQRTEEEQTANQTVVNQSVNFNPAEEYTIISCCNEGRMDIKINGSENEFTFENIKQILLDVYYNNCDRFPNTIQHSIYLEFNDKAPSRNYLISFTNANHNVLVTKGQYKEIDIDNCLLSK